MGGGFVNVGAWLLVLTVCSGCSVPTANDLRFNNRLYRDTGYKVKVPAERAAFVKPMHNGIEVQAVPASVTVSTSYPETAWDRAYTEMFYDILVDELADSGVVTEVEDRADPEHLVIASSLQTCSIGREATPSGERSYASVSLRVRVHGPVGEDGKRPLLRDKVFGDAIRSDIQLNPPAPAMLLGMVTRNMMAGLLQDLDAACVARKNTTTDDFGTDDDEWSQPPRDGGTTTTPPGGK